MGIKMVFEDGEQDYTGHFEPYLHCDVCSKRLTKSNLHLLSNPKRLGTFMVCSAICQSYVEENLGITFTELNEYFMKLRLLKNLGFREKDFGGN